MAEKPRLKESDEILYSIGKRRKSSPAVVQADILPPPIEDAGKKNAPAAPSRRKKRPAAQIGADSDDNDRNPLDFGKYELPKRRSRSGESPADPAEEAFEEDFAAPAAAEIVGAQPAKTRTPASRKAKAPALKPVAAEGSVPDADELRGKAGEKKSARAAAEEAAEEARRAAEKAAEAARVAKEEAEAEERALAEERTRIQEEERARIRAEERARIEREDQARREAEERARAEAESNLSEEETRRKLIEDDRYRDNVMKRLGNQFEELFSRQFDEGRKWDEQQRSGQEAPPKPSQKPRRSEEPQVEAKPEPVAAAPIVSSLTEAVAYEFPAFDVEKDDAPAQQAAAAEPDPDVDPDSEESADQFVRLFEEEVLREEESRTEDFKETLAQKFMRERERYLHELGISVQDDDEKEDRPFLMGDSAAPPTVTATPVAAAEAAEPPRRRLDFKIQPEMHTGESVVIPMPPVTYTRMAQVQPQVQKPEIPETAAADPVSAAPSAAPAASKSLPGGKKNAEQLLRELADQNRRRAFAIPEEKKPAQFNFHFTPIGLSEEPEDAAKGKGAKAGKDKPGLFFQKPLSDKARRNLRVIGLSATAGFMVLALVAWGINTIFRPENVVQQPGTSDMATTSDSRPLEVYENYTATSQAQVDNVVVKRSGITLGNLTVSQSVVVDETASTEGGLSMSNVFVGDMIYVKTSGVNELDLRDVQAERVVINNADRPVLVRASGMTDIGSIEVRTTATIEQGDLSADYPGVRSVVTKNEDTASSLSIDVKNATIQNLDTQGETTATFTGARIENMTSDGNLSLSGTGRIQTLSAGAGTGQGAGDEIPANPLSVLIKGVEVGHFNLRGSANVNVSAYVDTMAVSADLNLGGNGSIGSLIFNEQFGNGRLKVDISGVNVLQLTANAETLIYSSGSSIVNTLTANESTYALGNKVNTLKVNADGVIYENQPDSIQVAQGVSPPDSKANNPNLDYSLTTAQSGSASTDTTGDSVSTTCDHARDYGGFTQGDGSKGNPFVVQTPAQLAHVSQHLGSHFVQTMDIDIADDSNYASSFEMIAAEGVRFSGTYDGGGYVIRNLRINSDSEYTGLFAESTGTIRNVHIASGEITGGSKAYVGAIVGFNYQGGTVDSCSNGASIYASDSAYVGGIVGYNYGGKVRDSYNAAKVMGGDVTGGIVGTNRQGASVTGSYNAGLVEGRDVAGGLVGANEEAVATNCYFLEGTADEGVGNGSGNTVAVSTDRLSSAQLALDLTAGNDDSLWQQSTGGSYSFPTHKRPSGSPVIEYAQSAIPQEGSGDPATSDGDDDPDDSFSEE